MIYSEILPGQVTFLHIFLLILSSSMKHDSSIYTKGESNERV